MQRWRVRDVMAADVVAIDEVTPYREIVDILAEHRFSAVPVVNPDRRVVGVVSEADLLHKIEFLGDESQRRIFAGRHQRQARAKAHGALARDLMTAPAITIPATATLTAAAKLMDEARVKRLPVTGEHGELVGVVSRSDLLRVFLRPDAEIEQQVREEVLHRTLWVTPGMVEVRVRDGQVTLSGRTDRFTTAQLAVTLTQALPGVVEVHDGLGFEYDDRRLAEASHYGPGPFGMP